MIDHAMVIGGAAHPAAPAAVKEKFYVALNVEIDGQIHESGSTIELDLATAKLYNHALRAVEEKK